MCESPSSTIRSGLPTTPKRQSGLVVAAGSTSHSPSGGKSLRAWTASGTTAGPLLSGAAVRTSSEVPSGEPGGSPWRSTGAAGPSSRSVPVPTTSASTTGMTTEASPRDSPRRGSSETVRLCRNGCSTQRMTAAAGRAAAAVSATFTGQSSGPNFAPTRTSTGQCQR